MPEIYRPWNLYEKPTPHPLGSGLERDLTIEFAVNHRDWETERRLGEQIYETHIAGLPFHDALQRSLNVFLVINNIHFKARKGAVSRVQADAKLSSVLSHSRDLVVMEHAVAIPEGYLTRLHRQHESLQSTEGTSDWDRWFYPKVESFHRGFNAWKKNFNWILQLQERIGGTIIGRENEIREDADKIWRQLIDNRGYGIKTCFFPSPLFLDSSQVFYATDESLGIEDRAIRQIFIPDLVAIIGLGEKPAVTDEINPRIGWEENKRVKFHRIQMGKAYIAFGVTQDGVIHTSVETLLPLRKVFESMGAESVFELFRLFMFMRLYDLTARADLVNDLPSIDQLEAEAVKNREGFLGFGRRIKRFDYKRLVVPRLLKPIDSVSPEEGTENNEERRFIDRYHVIWFVRRLPIGYHASERATEYAREHGVVLRENETVVREHWRGKDTIKPSRATRAQFSN